MGGDHGVGCRGGLATRVLLARPCLQVLGQVRVHAMRGRHPVPQRRPAVQYVGRGQVQVGPTSRPEVPVHRGAHERVGEGGSRGARAHAHQPQPFELIHRPEHVIAVQPGHVDEIANFAPVAEGRGRHGHPTRVGRRRAELGEHELCVGVGRRERTVEALEILDRNLRQQRVEVQRDALGHGVQSGSRSIGDVLRTQRRSQGPYVGDAKTVEGQTVVAFAGHPDDPRWKRVDLAGAGREHAEHRVVPQPAQREVQRHQRGLIRQVDVVHGHQHRPPDRELSQPGEQCRAGGERVGPRPCPRQSWSKAAYGRWLSSSSPAHASAVVSGWAARNARRSVLLPMPASPSTRTTCGSPVAAAARQPSSAPSSYPRPISRVLSTSHHLPIRPGPLRSLAVAFTMPFPAAAGNRSRRCLGRRVRGDRGATAPPVEACRVLARR